MKLAMQMTRPSDVCQAAAERGAMRGVYAVKWMFRPRTSMLKRVQRVTPVEQTMQLRHAIFMKRFERTMHIGQATHACMQCCTTASHRSELQAFREHAVSIEVRAG